MTAVTLLLLQSEAVPELNDLNGPVWPYLRTMLVLALLIGCLLWLTRVWIPEFRARSQQATSGLHVVARLALEPRRSLYIVRIGTRSLLIGSSELGLSCVSPLEPEDLQGISSTAPLTFAEALRMTRRQS